METGQRLHGGAQAQRLLAANEGKETTQLKHIFPEGFLNKRSMYEKNVFVLNFVWHIINLQCCISFMCTAKWFIQTYIHSFSDSFLIKIIIEYWVEFLVLYIRSLLVIYFIYSSVCLLTKLLNYPSPLPFPVGNHEFLFWHLFCR